MEMSFVSKFGIFEPGTVIVFLTVLCATLWLYSKVTDRWSGKTRPPGPRGLPVVGNLLSLVNTDPRAQLAKYAEQYGDIFYFRLGNEDIVVLNSADVIREGFIRKGNSFADRPNLFFIRFFTKGKGIVSSNGPRWREQRRYTHTVLKDFGMGRSLLEDRVLEEVSFYLQELEKQNSCPQDITRLTCAAVSNVINNIVFGKRFDYDDPVFINMLKLLSESFEILGNGAICNFFPFLRHVPGDPFSINKLIADVPMADKFHKEQVEMHKSNQEHGLINSLIDAYLQKMKSISAEENTSEHFFAEDQMMQVVKDLFAAGAETTATTIRWAVLYLLHYPGIQQKLQQEIDDVIGRERLPAMTDFMRMPYTEAFIMETQRMGDIVPFSVPRCTTEDVELRGYTIPAGTSVWPNLNRVHFDPAVWGDPHNFRPERFLDKERKAFLQTNLMPFCVGRRVCLGESLARMELFLFVTSMLQKFSFMKPKDVTLPGITDGILGITSFPKPYTACVTVR